MSIWPRGLAQAFGSGDSRDGFVIMIWTLRVECIWGIHLEEECIRVIEIESESSLMQLHDVIQDAVDFDRDHLFEFFAGRNWRNRKVLFDDSFHWEDSFEAYDSITLEEVYPLPKSCKLYYHFDFGDDWYFEIRKSRRKPREPEAGVSYPRVVEAIGLSPPQYGRFEEDLDFEILDTEDG